MGQLVVSVPSESHGYVEADDISSRSVADLAGVYLVCGGEEFIPSLVRGDGYCSLTKSEEARVEVSSRSIELGEVCRVPIFHQQREVTNRSQSWPRTSTSNCSTTRGFQKSP